MATIALANGQQAQVDDDLLPKFAGRRWKQHTEGYAVANYRIGGINRTRYMHREVIDAPPGLHVDHRNGDKLDNRRENLRLVSGAQNQAVIPPRSATGFKGVSRSGSRFVARCAGAYLGSFKTAEEAANAYDLAAARRYGPLCWLNFAKGVSYAGS